MESDREHERVPEAAEPQSSGLLTALTDLGRNSANAIAGAVSSMGSPPRPEPGPPPENLQNQEQQQLANGVHAIHQSAGAQQHEGVQNNCACSTLVANATNIASATLTQPQQGLCAPTGAMFESLTTLPSQGASGGASAEGRLPGAILPQFQSPQHLPMYASPAYRGFDGEAIIQNGREPRCFQKLHGTCVVFYFYTFFSKLVTQHSPC